MTDACVNMNSIVVSCTCTAHARGWWRHVRRRKSFLIFLQTLPLKKDTPLDPHHPQSITFTYSNPGRDVLNKTRLLLVKFENKGRFHAERRDDYQSDTLWATCQHYTVKKKKKKKRTFPPPFKSSSDTKRLMQH